ncbi:stalk domain-containing protein [Bengtsoniella intestinalis]|uniref:stalk domain-containing protein n=1 Tax=Bengtsoniella intestinalis TaxID=3073143 RepID=UPI00391F6D66
MKKKDFAAGLVLGAVIFGATPAIASGIIAELSSQPIYVDGVQVEMTAYSINGNNYVKLRDIGEAVGFDVSWNSTEQRVDIDSTSPYTADDTVVVDSTPHTVAEMVSETYLSSNDTKTSYQVTVTNQTIDGKLSNGQDPTEENIRAMLEEIIAIYPQYTSWGATYNDGDLHWYEGHTACNSYAYMVRDILYGTDCEPAETLTDLSQVQTGDIVYLKNTSTNRGHWMVVSGVGTNSLGMYINSMSGNSNAMVFVDAPYYLSAAQEEYPDSVIYRYY